MNYCPYKVTERGLVDKRDVMWSNIFVDLLRGVYTIEKLPWKPKNGDEYYYVTLYYTPEIELTRFDSENPFEIALYKCGWIFRTKEEAESNKERVLKEMKEVISE